MESRNCDAGFIAVHLGAGYHAQHNLKEYRAVCQQACREAIKLICSKVCALDVVTTAVSILEDSPLTNAGVGSNLNLCGNVECDASIMEGSSLQYGAVGALSGIKNPVCVCRALILEQKKGPMSCGRIPPSFLVSSGALQWARDHGIDEVATSSLLTKSSLAAYRKHKRRLSAVEESSTKKLNTGDSNSSCLEVDGATAQRCRDSPLDTVGAVCVDADGNVSSAVSSGGIALKHPGRVGQAASYGCGCWAWNGRDTTPSVASSTSGCGEHLVKTLLAKECCDGVLQSDGCPAAGVERVFTDKFLKSPVLASVDERLGGALVLSHCRDEGVELVWAHTTETMCLAYMSSGSDGPKILLKNEVDRGLEQRRLQSMIIDRAARFPDYPAQPQQVNLFTFKVCTADILRRSNGRDNDIYAYACRSGTELHSRRLHFTVRVDHLE